MYSFLDSTDKVSPKSRIKGLDFKSLLIVEDAYDFLGGICPGTFGFKSLSSPKSESIAFLFCDLEKILKR